MKPDLSDTRRVRAFEARLDRPIRPVIIGATAYWLEDTSGRRLADDSPTSDAPLSQALAEVASGVDPADLRLVCQGPGFDRYEVSRGVILVDIAEGALGVPARLRQPGRERHSTA